jgi:segregation and condensation protein A
LLLPVDKKENKEGAEEIDPKEELLLRILRYKKFKEFSTILREQEEHWGKTLFKGPESIDFVFEDEDLNISPYKLKELYIRIIRNNRAKRNEKSKDDMVKIIQYEKVSLKSKIREIVRALIDKASIKFSEIFFKAGKTKLEVVTGFLAILELAKLRKVELFQKAVFDEIEIKRMDVSEQFISEIPDEEQNIS